MNDGQAAAPRIVVGVDGSEPSEAALRWAVGQAGLIGAVVEAVLAWEYPRWYGMGVVVSGFDFESNAATVLSQALDEALEPGVPAGIRRRVVFGHPAEALLEASRGAELLVVGNRGHGGFTEALLGSVTQHVVQHAPCPVVVVRKPGQTDGPGGG
ncbi:hypothetical protein AQJ66_25590 [Streptomyces bungoensis]|uniref:UspA domain-containing protein n=1 Tax=Streptomyces bungoensis TaxID=285568 RepID=A0A101SUY8_9ACTN|nr:universal stress protein [Streptomyces bungoensis]KUN80526.1 hypothetical protein AQJ66_25590 [Streptomyces bungoensis]